MTLAFSRMVFLRRREALKYLSGFVMISCFFACFGCSRGQGKLDGDVFIVTQGAENVKLGLVEIRVLPYEETKTSVAATRAQVEREVANLLPKLVAARDALASADRAVKNSYGAEVSLKRFNVALDARTSAQSALAPLEEQAQRWNSCVPYFASLPPPVTAVKTDADGKFSIPLDRTATVVLAANATRHLLKKTETHCWLVTVSLDGQPNKRIFLSNDNLATTDSKDSLVHVVE